MLSYITEECWAAVGCHGRYAGCALRRDVCGMTCAVLCRVAVNLHAVHSHVCGGAWCVWVCDLVAVLCLVCVWGVCVCVCVCVCGGCVCVCGGCVCVWRVCVCVCVRESVCVCVCVCECECVCMNVLSAWGRG